METKQPLRGRHAGNLVNNVLGGLARYPACGSSMTLVSKSKTWRYLVCSKAKVGAGCEYRVVRYEVFERCIVDYAAEIAAEAPSGSPEADALADQIASLENYADSIVASLEGLLETASHRPSAAIAERIGALEVELAGARKEIAALTAKHTVLAPLSWRRRLSAFTDAAQTDPLDRQTVNASLRAILDAVVVNYTEGRLQFRWKGSSTTSVQYAWPDEPQAAARIAPASPQKAPQRVAARGR